MFGSVILDERALLCVCYREIGEDKREGDERYQPHCLVAVIEYNLRRKGGGRKRSVL